MEFLKNHYEKIILSVVLVGLIGTAGFLALQSMGFRSMMTDTRELKPIPQKPSEASRTNEFNQALTNARAPQEVDFDGDHKIFSPEKIIKNLATEEVLTAKQVGPKNLVVQAIQSHALSLQQEVRTLLDKKSLYVKYLPEYEYGAVATRWGKSTVREGRKINLSGPVSRSKGIELTVVKAPENLEDAAQIQTDLELVIGGGLPEKLTLQGEAIWKKDILFSAALYYPPTKQEYKEVRVGTPLVFAGDTNTVIQITESEVTMRATSNNKRTTIKLPKQPVAP